jgi:hypothetical protein
MKKIIKHGYLADDGIEIECSFCHCLYVVENKNDLDVEMLYDPQFQDKTPEYSVTCPMCGRVMIFGTERYSRHPIFTRNDWCKRYSYCVEKEGEKLCSL